MEPKLTKVLKDSSGEDISHMGIYDDGKQFRVQYKCPICKEIQTCLCYPTLDEAIEECTTGASFYCDRHWLLEMWEEHELWEVIDKVCGTRLGDKIILMNMYETGEIGGNPKYNDRRIDEVRRECNHIVENLPSDEILSIIIQTDRQDTDDDLIGESCEI